ncbi:hypothetical protein CKO25_16215 [Thiocapsa imhoffii]|uniref:Uncharacterized protein n=1 Tax=Thiocapsa imhoffii TaxID=382777 RepID=A0A9X1BAN4_9GAMM|nr:hypothetical protein [Thiocapsa imhoffii]
MKLRFATSADCRRPPAGFRKRSFLSRVTQPELRHEHPSGDREASPPLLVAKLRFVTREMKLRFTTPADCQRPPAGLGKRSFFSCVSQPELRHEHPSVDREASTSLLVAKPHTRFWSRSSAS